MHSPSENPRGGAVGRWAGWSLVAAIAVAVVGLLLARTGVAPFAGGLLLAFGEAALVGGLADWFAVRALFGHPLGVPLPHTALIPRNRRRIVAELRALVENEWLPRPMLVERVRSFDFVGNAFLPFVHSHKETSQDLLRTVARSVASDVSPEQVAGFLARAAARALQTDDLVQFLAAAARRARQEGWLEPLMRQWLKRLEEWAGSPESHAVIYAHLERAGTLYRGQGWFKSFTYQVAEVFGGLDLHAAATLLQNEIGRFAREQGGDEGHIRRVLSEGLEHIEQKLRDDPAFVRGLRNFLVETSDAGTLPVLFRPVLASVQAEALRELDRPDSPLLAWAVRQIEGWLVRVESDEATRAEVNGWCRQIAEAVVDRHHAVIGHLVEEQLERLSDERLVTLIEDRVGEDLNWIRLNGTVLGGLIGVGLYLLFWALSTFVGR